MKTFTKAFAALGVAAGAIISSTPVQAQSVNVNADITLARTLQLYNDGDLHFGLITPGRGGTVTIDPTATGARSETGGITLLNSASYPTSSGIVRAVGEPDTGLTFNITVPGGAVFSASDALDLAVSNDLPVSPRLDNPGGGADGTLIVRLGGTVDISAASTPGLYRGTIQVSAAYQ